MKKNILIFLLLIVTFSGCSKFQDLKKDLSMSLYSQKQSKNQSKDKKILTRYQKNFNLHSIDNLTGEKLSKEKGQLGLWLPYKFINEVGGGIYILNEYDQNKTPIVFIHGAGGNAVEWNDIMKSIDKEKFQPIFISYPSGIKLDYTVNIITQKMNTIINKYDVKNMIIIAHSMGGLVAKSVIKNLNQNQYVVNKFITLSTPWQGHMSASNTKDLPYYIPSWLDMQPNSSFINSIKDRSILKNVEHYLMFGFQGKLTLYGRDNDGTISLESQLSEYAQNSATKMFGFNETHTSILSSEKVIEKINIILKDKL